VALPGNRLLLRPIRRRSIHDFRRRQQSSPHRPRRLLSFVWEVLNSASRSRSRPSSSSFTAKCVPAGIPLDQGPIAFLVRHLQGPALTGKRQRPPKRKVAPPRSRSTPVVTPRRPSTSARCAPAPRKFCRRLLRRGNLPKRSAATGSARRDKLKAKRNGFKGHRGAGVHRVPIHWPSSYPDRRSTKVVSKPTWYLTDFQQRRPAPAQEASTHQEASTQRWPKGHLRRRSRPIQYPQQQPWLPAVW